jgi:hypothetical protein
LNDESSISKTGRTFYVFGSINVESCRLGPEGTGFDNPKYQIGIRLIEPDMHLLEKLASACFMGDEAVVLPMFNSSLRAKTAVLI